MSRVLLVNIILTGRTGTEVVCSETARGLRDRHHEVAIYVQHGGRTADELRAEGFQVVTDLQALKAAPDIIQANQTYPLLEAVGRFPDVPAISICHDATTWFDEPLDLPSIRRHLAVDVPCRERVAARCPRLEHRIEILHNAVDLARFERHAGLPEKPRRALLIAKRPEHIDAVVAACAQRDMPLDTCGPAGIEVDDLGTRLCHYDLVFATARSALEAMAAGCAVILVQGTGLAGLVTADVAEDWRHYNFGHRLLSRGVSADALVAEIDRFDRADAKSVSDHVREHSSLDGYLDRLEEIHREIAKDAAAPIDRDDLIRAMSRAARLFKEAFDRQTSSGHPQTLADAMAARLTDLELKAAAKEIQLRTGYENRMRAAEREFQAREAELRLDFAKAARMKQQEFQAYVEWVAPRNLGRRIIHKLRRLLSDK